MKKILNIILVFILLITTVLPFLPVQRALALDTSISYPKISTSYQYYETTFPIGLKYSDGWYGTFTYAPPAHEILLFDDTWIDTEDGWGRCIFSMPIGIKPLGQQGGTTLRALKPDEADAILKSYELERAYTPYDKEIEVVMQPDHFYIGVWAGSKLRQKFQHETLSVNITQHKLLPEPIYTFDDGTPLTTRQVEYINATRDVTVRELDLMKFDPDRYWVGDGGNWSGNVTHWSASSDGAPGASKPTSADNVYFDAASFTAAGQTVTVDETAYCLSMDWTGALNSPTLALNESVAFYGNVTLINQMSITSAFNKAFIKTGANNVIFDTGGLISNYRLSTDSGASNTITLGNVFNSTHTVSSSVLILNNGNFDTAGYDITIQKVFYSAQTSGRTLTLGTSVITCDGISLVGATMPTVTANTAIINVSGTGVVALGDVDWNGASFNLTGTAHTVSGSPTGIATFTRTGTATKTDTVTFTSGDTLTCTTFAMIGNSVTNRLLVQSSTLGSPATITATNWTGSANVDIMDITVTNPVDLSAITGGSGDCQGNTDITFTAAVSATSTKASTWSDPTMWDTGLVPKPQDDVSCSHSVTVDMPRIGKSVTFTGTPTVSLSDAITNYGSLILISGMTLTTNSKLIALRGRSDGMPAGGWSFDSGGVTIFDLAMRSPNAAYKLISDVPQFARLYVGEGTFDFNDYNITTGRVYLNQYGGTSHLDMGSGTLTMSYGAASTDKWAIVNPAGFTLNSETSTIIITNSSTGAQTFAGGGLTYNNVIVQGAGNYALTITGSNTFKSFKVDASEAAKTVKFTDGTTQTISTSFTRDSGTNLITLQGTAAAGWDIDFDGTAPVSLDYMSISGSTSTPVDTWYAGTHSTDGGGNTGWVFDYPLWVKIYVDGILKDYELMPEGYTIPDTATNWTFSNFVYADSIAIYKGGTKTLEYLPTALITSDTMPDSVGSNDGAITWGTNSGITVTGGSIETSKSATSVGATSAMMQGELIDIGTYAGVYLSFEYGLDTSYGYFTSETAAVGTQTHSVTLTGLTPNTTYHYRAIARDGIVYTYGEDKTFTTALSDVSQGSTTPLIIELGAFSGYAVTGDLLVTAEIVLTYPPYYPTKSANRYFQMQLLDTDGVTILGASPVSQWGDRPTSIYFNPTVAATLTYGEEYTIRVSNISSENITVNTADTLAATDWRGNDLKELDNWCIGVSTHMQNTDGTILTDPYLSSDPTYGLRITETPTSFFIIGIPSIEKIRPSLFVTGKHQTTLPGVQETISYNSGATIGTKLGTTIENDSQTVADVFGLTGKQFLQFAVFGVVVVIVLYVVSESRGGGAVGALCLTIPIIGASMYNAITDVQMFAALGILAVIIGVYKFVLSRL